MNKYLEKIAESKMKLVTPVTKNLKEYIARQLKDLETMPLPK